MNYEFLGLRKILGNFWQILGTARETLWQHCNLLKLHLLTTALVKYLKFEKI